MMISSSSGVEEKLFDSFSRNSDVSTGFGIGVSSNWTICDLQFTFCSSKTHFKSPTSDAVVGVELYTIVRSIIPNRVSPWIDQVEG